jgi:hypothetical protein
MCACLTREVMVKYPREKKNRVFSAKEQLLRDDIEYRQGKEGDEEKKKKKMKKKEETKHTDVCGIEKGIPGEKSDRVRVARQSSSLSDSIAIAAVVCFPLTACASCTTHIHHSAEKKNRER